MKAKPFYLYPFFIALTLGSLLVPVAVHIFWQDLRIFYEPLHSTIEAIGAIASIFMAIFLLQEKKGDYAGTFFWVAMGFLNMGILDGFAAVSRQGYGLVLFHNVAVFMGSFWFALTWIKGLASAEDKNWKRAAPWIVIAGSISFGFLALLNRDALPAMVHEGKFTTTAVVINFLAGVLFVVASFRFLMDYHYSERLIFYFFACLSILFGVTALNSSHSAPWNMEWWLWHAQKLLAYILVFGFLVYEYQDALLEAKAKKKVEEINKELENEILERMRVEDRVAGLNKDLEAANRDIQRQNAVLDAMSRVFHRALICETEEDLGKTCLDVAEELSGSKFGFLGELNKECLFDTIAISNPGWDICEVPVGQATLSIKNMPVRGVDRSVLREGKPRIVNGMEAIQSHPDHVEVPKGHPPVTAFLGVPLKEAGKTIGMIGLGNREGGYTLAIQEDMEKLAVAIVEALKRKRSDIHIRNLNEEIQQKNSELSASNKELEGFSYSVSHDLRVPLRAIDGFSSRLVEDYSGKLDDEGKRLLGVVIKSARKMGKLIDDLLNFSRVGRKEMALAAVDMERLARAVFEELASGLENTPPEFIINPMPPAAADPSLIRHVLVNLIGNAVKFTGRKEGGAIEVGGTDGEKENTYYVKDNGAGFEMKYVDKLFGVFQRLHTEEEFQGTGIGLAIVKRIVARHGGRVWAEGEAGKGAAFYFTLPRTPSPF